jgi:putative ABC transport system permease protein
MLKNYLKIAFRNLSRQKTYSLINIAGLAIGLACFILVILYVQYEFGYDDHHINGENIYRVNIIQQHPNGEFKLSSSMVPLGPALHEEIPDIIDYTRLENNGKTVVQYEDKKFIENNVIFADQGLLRLFSIPVVHGNLASALTKKFSVVITESVANKYFGNQSAIGKTLLADNEVSLTVTAVVKDFPRNTHLKTDFAISFLTLQDLTSESYMTNWVTTRLSTYILLKNNQNIAEVQKRANEVMTAHSTTEVKRALEFEQFNRIHLYSDVTPFGDINRIYLFLAIGILILIIASINFMNLATARSARRANEVGLRKVVGAKQVQIIRQFIGESILTAFLALILAIIIVYNILPFFKNLSDQDLVMPHLSEWQIYGMFFLITSLVGLLSGSYPAFYLSSSQPISVLRGRQGSAKKNQHLRTILVVLQFSITIALIISTLGINNQIDFMRFKKLGFQKEHVIIVPVNGNAFRQDTDGFKQELLRHANISAVAGSILLPSRIGMYNNVTWEGAAENESISLMQNKIDYDFLGLYEIEVIQGRNFSREYSSDIADYSRKNLAGAIILNEEAVRRFGWKDPIDKKVIQTFGNERYIFNVVGVIKDFHFSSLHNRIVPLSLFLNPANPGYFSIKVAGGDIQNTLAIIRQIWQNLNPQVPFEYYFLDESFEQIYQSEERLHTLFSYFSLLSIFIACLGLFGLAAFSAEQRTKEIGIRKVFGASSSNILILLSREFTKWIIFANLIAWPAAWIYLNSWLGEFAYRTDINWWLFVIAGGLAMVIALLTISYQALKAAMTNPADALRYE